MNWMMVSQIGLWIVMLVLLGLMFLLIRMVNQFLYRFRLSTKQVEEQQLKLGQKAPLFRAKDQQGNTVRLAEHTNEFTLLIFAKSTCSICHRVIDQLPALIKPFDIRCIILFAGGFQDSKGDLTFSVVESTETFENYLIEKVPHLVLINKNNEIIGTFNHSNFRTLPSILRQNLDHLSRSVFNH